MSYNKKTWANGDLITKESMNNIENGIYNAHDEIGKIKNNTSSGTGITPEQAQQLNTAYTHSQSAHVQTSDIPTKTSELTNDSDYVNSTYVTNKITEATLSGGGSTVTTASDISITDTGNYFTNSDVEGALQEVGSQIKDIANKGTTVDVLERVIKETVDGKIASGEMANLTIEDNSITFEKLQKSYAGKTEGTVVDYWYYNNNTTKRTDGKSIEYPVIAGNTYRIPNAISNAFGNPYLLSTDKETVYVNKNNYTSIIIDGVYYFTPAIDGYLTICYSYGNTIYYPNIPLYCSDGGLDTTEFIGHANMWLKIFQTERIEGLKRDYSGIWYNLVGNKMTDGTFPIYKVEDGYWYKSTSGFILIDEEYNFIKHHNNNYIYADGTFRYIQPTNTGIVLSRLKTGITTGGDLPFIDEKRNSVDYNKPLYKGIACFGDSIMAGGIPVQIGELGNCSAINYASSGASTARICKNITGYGEINASKVEMNEGQEIVLIQTGINDTVFNEISNAIPSNVTGSIKDILDGNTITVGDTTVSTLDNYYALFTTDMTGQLAFIIEWLQATYPNKRILLCNYHNNSSRQERVVLQENIVKAISEYYGVEMIDIRRSCGINTRNESIYLSDGLHPNEDGNKKIALGILRKM